jgi:hypothetical protein
VAQVARGWLELDLRASISFRLFFVSDGGNETFGSLNMFTSRAHAFDGTARALGQVFASHAAVALNAAITEARLEQAVRSRDVIGLAKGILMERHDLGADEPSRCCGAPATTARSRCAPSPNRSPSQARYPTDIGRGAFRQDTSGDRPASPIPDPREVLSACSWS